MTAYQVSSEIYGGFFYQGITLRTFARNFSNIDFFLKILPSKDNELVTSEM